MLIKRGVGHIVSIIDGDNLSDDQKKSVQSKQEVLEQLESQAKIEPNKQEKN